MNKAEITSMTLNRSDNRWDIDFLIRGELIGVQRFKIEVEAGKRDDDTGVLVLITEEQVIESARKKLANGIWDLQVAAINTISETGAWGRFKESFLRLYPDLSGEENSSD